MKRVCVCVSVCVCVPACVQCRERGWTTGMCSFRYLHIWWPQRKTKKKKKNLVTYVVFVMTLYKHVRVNESFFFKDYNKNVKSELFFIYFASTNFKILYLGQKPYPMFKGTNISFSPG